MTPKTQTQQIHIVKKFTVKPKLTADQFNKTLLASKEQIQAVIKKFDLDDSQLKQLNEKINKMNG